MSDHHKYIIIIVGPTAAGKTDFSLNLAQHMRAQIINMDMGQCYTPLTIGTAKPDWRSMKAPHHLFDLIDEPRNITVVQYRAACVNVMQQIWARGNMPILVGGSGFYLQSLFFPPFQEENAIKIEPHLDAATLWETLNAIDPHRARLIHPNDTYRLQRALYIWHSTGKKPSEYMPIYNPPSSYDVYCLTRDRHELYQRIDARVLAMMHEGWIDEAKGLLGTPWEDFLRSKKIIGYPDIFDYLSGDLSRRLSTPSGLASYGRLESQESMQAMIHAIQQKTRNYAKRQMTFWRKLEKDLKNQHQFYEENKLQNSEIEAISLTLLGVDLYINQLLKKVDTWFA